MSTPFVGEIRLCGFNFAPEGWAFCNGQLLAISSYEALYNLIGTTYGGDGQQTFALPNLQGRVPLHWGTGPGLSTYVAGQGGGTEDVSLTVQQLPQHNHLAGVTAAYGTVGTPSNAILGATNSGTPTAPVAGNLDFTTSAPDANLASNALAMSGGAAPHNNIQPSVVVNFIISLFGIYPSQA